ncbi:hypothetical protein BC829DRAFT_88586 [Chytridium lagenaria]|nr:hypothetical protein BC829DRAFT_88586 [Chytridium lagenaria]
MLLRVGRYERWHAGRTIVKEGHIATNYYILLDGEIEVSRINRDLVEAHITRLLDQEEKTEKERMNERSRERERRRKERPDDEEASESESEKDEEEVLEERRRIERKRIREELERVYTDVLGTQSSGESLANSPLLTATSASPASPPNVPPNSSSLSVIILNVS